MPQTAKKLKKSDQPKSDKSFSFTVSKNFKVDQARGEISDLVLLKVGREAKGHGIYLDDKTLQGAVDSVSEKGGQLKSYIRHKDLEERWYGKDRLMEMPGFFSGVKGIDQELKADLFQFYDAFKEAQPDAFSLLMEIADKSPALIGLSVEISGYLVYIDTDGNEYSGRPEDVDLLYEGVPVMRITELSAAAFVSDPAATDGLFSQIKKVFSANNKTITSGEMDLIQVGVKAYFKANSESAVDKPVKVINPKFKKQPTQQPMEELTKLLKAAFSADAKQLNAALLYVGMEFKEGMTVADVQTALSDEAATVELARLKAENKKLLEFKTENETLKKAAEKKDESFDKLKNSGVTGDGIGLGMGGGNAGNPKGGYTGLTQKVMASGKLDGFDFAVTTIADGFVPEIFIPALAEMKPTRQSLLSTGVVVQDPTLTALAQGAGQTVIMPFFHDPDFRYKTQKSLTAPSINKITASKMVSAFMNREGAIGVDGLVADQTGTDPLGHALSRLPNIRSRDRYAIVLIILNALFGTDGTAAFASLRSDNHVEDESAQAPDNFWQRGMFSDGTALLGEVANELHGGAMIVHPDIMAAMDKQNDLTTVRDSEGGFILTSYREMPLFTSNALKRAGTTSGNVYDTYILGPRTLGMGDRIQESRTGTQASLMIDEDKKINQTLLIDRQRFLMHVNGSSYIGTPANADEGPTDAELALPASWELALEDVQNVGMTKITTNG